MADTHKPQQGDEAELFELYNHELMRRVARVVRTSPDIIDAASSSTPMPPLQWLLGADSIEELLKAEPGEIAARFIITREDGTPVPESDLPGQRLVAGEDAPSLLTRSVDRRTGREYWLLTKATLLETTACSP